jgi:hypothetical protein
MFKLLESKFDYIQSFSEFYPYLKDNNSSGYFTGLDVFIILINMLL